MNASRTGLVLLALTALASTPAVEQESLPIDRWLVSDVIVPDSSESTDALDRDLLHSPGEPGVLPDRGLPAAGVTWHLLRRDGASEFALDSLVSAPTPGAIVYAHTYLRLRHDRTLRLEWRATECAGGRAWVNGREITGPEADVRFGAGWNTLLLKLESGDCPLGFAARLSTIGSGSLDELKVQASRPFGDVRTGPADWVVPGDTARFSEARRWRGDRLYAGLLVGLTAWGRAPVSGVELELRSGANGKIKAPWLTPGTRTDVAVPIRLDRVEKLLEAGAIDVRIKWDDDELDRRLHVAGSAPTPAPDERIELDGWEVRRVAAGGRASRIDGGLPNASGWEMTGEWKVPEALAGRTLVLVTETAPADYRLNGSQTKFAGEGVTLCAPCKRGAEIELRAHSTGAWSAMPVVRVGAGPDAP